MSFENPGDDVRCDHCDTPGEPYEYKGKIFSGLTAWEGERLCPRCRDHKWDREVTPVIENAPVSVISGPYRYRDWQQIKERIKTL